MTIPLFHASIPSVAASTVSPVVEDYLRSAPGKKEAVKAALLALVGVLWHFCSYDTLRSVVGYFVMSKRFSCWSLSQA